MDKNNDGKLSLEEFLEVRKYFSSKTFDVRKLIPGCTEGPFYCAITSM